MSSVVNVPKAAKLFGDHSKYKAKMEEIFKVYGDVLSAQALPKPSCEGGVRQCKDTPEAGILAPTQPRLPDEGRGGGGNDQDPKGVQ